MGPTIQTDAPRPQGDSSKPEGYLDLSEVFGGPSVRTYAIRVDGDYLRDLSIVPGDYVVFRDARRAKEGDIVIVRANEPPPSLSRVTVYKTLGKFLAIDGEGFFPIEKFSVTAVAVGIIRKVGA